GVPPRVVAGVAAWVRLPCSATLFCSLPSEGKSVGHYRTNVRDIEFNLFEVLNIGEVLAAGGYGDLDVDTARTMLDEVARLAEGPGAESFADADRNPPVLHPPTARTSRPRE